MVDLVRWSSQPIEDVESTLRSADYTSIMNNFDVQSQIDTEAEPDVLLFSPLDTSLLVVGTYHLNKDGQRNGSLLLYTLDSESNAW